MYIRLGWPAAPWVADSLEEFFLHEFGTAWALSWVPGHHAPLQGLKLLAVDAGQWGRLAAPDEVVDDTDLLGLQ
jgi:hypothetical protein